MRRRIPTLLLISATLAVTACGDNSTTAPVPSARSTPSFSGYAVSVGDDGGNTFASLAPNSTSTLPETISPKGGSFTVGNFTLTYRNGSVSLCDDAGANCSPLTQSIDVAVTTGPTWIDINTTGAQTGKHLYFATPGAKLSTTWQSTLANGGRLGILYAPTPGSPSEYNAPKSHFNKNTGELWRWVSHFSGYAVSTGGDCDPSMDPTCASSPDGMQ